MREIKPLLTPGKYFQMFETGYSGWRFYRSLLSHPDIISTVRSDTWDCLLAEGLIT